MQPMFLVLIPALLVAAPSVCTAAEQPDDATAQVKVRFHDLNLQRPGDAKTLLGRIERASLEACGASDQSIPEYRRLVARSKCYSSSVEAAIRKINSPLLTELYGHNISANVASR